jgi:MFS family permease
VSFTEATPRSANERSASGGRTRQAKVWTLLLGSGVFGKGCTIAEFSPGYWSFAPALAVIGVAALTFTAATNSMMQLSNESTVRGRVMAIRVGVALEGTAIGAPIVGRLANHFGLRWSLGIGAASGFAATVVAVYVVTWQAREARTLEISD